MAGWMGAAGTVEWGNKPRLCSLNSRRCDRSWPEPLAVGTRNTCGWVCPLRKSPQTLDAVLRRQGTDWRECWGCRPECSRVWYNIIDPTSKGREPVVIGDLLNARHSWNPSHLSIMKLLPISNSQLKLQTFQGQHRLIIVIYLNSGLPW